MLTCENIKDLLKTKKPTFDKYYVGKLDTKYIKSICVYSGQTDKTIAIGGKETTKTKSAAFKVLIHYNNNYTTTEKVAAELYESISAIQKEAAGEYIIEFVNMKYGAAIDLHTSDSGIYERMIEFVVYYK